jgi:hypothetical protein
MITGTVEINAYPAFDAMRSEPRFQALVQHMHFPQQLSASQDSPPPQRTGTHQNAP